MNIGFACEVNEPLKSSFCASATFITLEPRLRLSAPVVMSTDLNSDREWLRRLIEVMDAIESQYSGPSASKRATQDLRDRLRLPADRMSDHVSADSFSPLPAPFTTLSALPPVQTGPR